ncbi:MAG: YlbF family regulator [Bacillota bacterium]|nr:YlbF family regulator [Bacillota bacterium]
MDIIRMARDLAQEIQKQEFYLKLQIAKQNSDEDTELQNLIQEFNLKRMAINNEAAKSDRDDEKLQQFNTEMREAYAKIMQNENMTAYNSAKEEMDHLLQRVFAIISQSAEGDDPETTDYVPSCGGSCSSCSGCH